LEAKNKPSAEKTLIEDVSRLIALPSNEEPAIASANGLKTLIYTQAKKAIIYDPDAKKIIDVATFNMSSSATTSATPGVKIVLRNGTKTTGLTTRIEPEVKKSLTNAQVITKENASKTTFEKSIVVALNDAAKDEATKLAKDMNIEMGELPDGESKPTEGDLLVILGKDRI
jgi:hypothetical protein